VIKLVEADVIVGAVVRPANEPEHHALALLTSDIIRHGPLAEVLIDRGYPGSPQIGSLHAQGIAIRAKAWTTTNRGRFPKHAFDIRLTEARVILSGAAQRGDSRRCHDGTFRHHGLSAL
jgi:hypothetical protein